MSLNVNQDLHLHLGPGVPQNLIIPNSGGILTGLPPLGVIDDSNFKSSAQVVKIVSKTFKVLIMLNISIVGLTTGGFAF